MNPAMAVPGGNGPDAPLQKRPGRTAIEGHVYIEPVFGQIGGILPLADHRYLAVSKVTFPGRVEVIGVLKRSDAESLAVGDQAMGHFLQNGRCAVRQFNRRIGAGPMPEARKSRQLAFGTQHGVDQNMLITGFDHKGGISQMMYFHCSYSIVLSDMAHVSRGL